MKSGWFYVHIMEDEEHTIGRQIGEFDNLSDAEACKAEWLASEPEQEIIIFQIV